MSKKVQSPVAWLQNHKHKQTAKQAAKKGRHNRHEVGKSVVSQGMMESVSEAERPGQTRVGDRQTEKSDVSGPILQANPSGQGQDQELLDEMLARPRPPGAPPTYEAAIKHSGSVDIPSSPPPGYSEGQFILSTDDLKKQSRTALKAFEKADKSLKAQQNKVSKLKKELANKIQKQGEEKSVKLREKLEQAKTELEEQKSARTQLEQEKERSEKALDEANTAEIDEGSIKHKSRLANIIKPWLTLNKEEIAGLKIRKEAAAKEFGVAEKHHKHCTANHKDCLKTLEKAIRKARPNIAGQGASGKLHENLLQAKKELDQATAQLEAHRQQLAEVEAEIKEANKNTDSLVEFALSFATNLRKLHKLSQKDTAAARREMARLQTFSVPRLVIDTPDGKLQVENLKLQLKTLSFKQNQAGQWVPTLGIESMSGQIKVPMPDRQSMVVALNLQDVTVDLDAGFGSPLHSYVTSPFGLTGMVSALAGVPKSVEALLPRQISLKGKKVGVLVDDLSPATIAAMAHKGQSTPGSAADKMFEALEIGIDAQLQDLAVDTRGGLNLQVRAKDAEVQYNPDPVNKRQKSSTHRKVQFKASHGAITVSEGIPVLEKLLKELEIDDPVKLIPGLAKSKKTVSIAELSSLSKKLDIEITKPNVELSRELKKKQSWVLTGANGLDTSAESLTITNTGDVDAKVKVKDFRLHTEPVRNGGNKIAASASHASLDINNSRDLLSQNGPLVSAGLVEAGTDLTGKARVSLVAPRIQGQMSNDQYSMTCQLPRLEASVEETVKLSQDDDGLILPKELKLTVHGEVKLENKDDVTTVTPQLRAQANDRHGKIFVRAKGKSIPVDLKAEATLHKAPYQTLSYTDESTGKTVTTPVITQGGLTIKAPVIGPMRMHDLTLNLDKNCDGKLQANDVEINLASLDAGDRVDFVKRAGEEPSVIIEDDPVPWYAKPLLANKRLHVCAEAGIKRGQINMKDLRVSRLKFTNTKDAGPVDRAVTAILNIGSGLVARRLHKCELTHKAVQAADPGGKRITVRKPFIVLKLWPIKRSYPLDIPAHLIDPNKETISAAHALHEHTGLIMTQQRDFDAIVDGIRQVKLGKRKGLVYLGDLCRKYSQTSDGLKPVQLLAEQFPIEHARRILRDCPDKQRPEIESALNLCASIFVNYPRLQTQAIRIYQLIGYTPSQEMFRQMETDVYKNKSADPTGLATLMLSRDRAKARELFELALSRELSTAIAHTRLGCEMLKTVSKSSKSPNGAQTIQSAMGHLLRGALEGSTEARETLVKSEKNPDPLLSAEAKLAHSVLLLKKETSREDFYQAIERLESLVQESQGRTRDVAKRLLRNRVRNARQIFHTENEEAFVRTQESIRQLRKDIRMRRPLPTGRKAYSLGIKHLYAADGAPGDIELAVTLLKRAENEVPAARVHLQIATNKA